MKNTVKLFFNILGYEIRQKPKLISQASIIGDDGKILGGKVYMGCGDDSREGYIGVDLRKTNSVTIASKAWELSQHCANLDEVYTRHMLEHLTFSEVRIALIDWFDSLRIGGNVDIWVPNMEFHIEQWSAAKWDIDEFKEKKSNTAWALAGFWGWQRECDPLMDDYNNTYWDVHKSGYCKESLAFFLTEAGFDNVKIEIINKCHLRATAIRLQ